MKVNVTIHNSHLLRFDHQATSEAVSQQLESILQSHVMSQWLGNVDWFDADIWVWLDDVSGFGGHPYVEIDQTHREYERGSINCSLSWVSIYIDQNHELFHEKQDQLTAYLISAWMYMLVDFAKHENENEVIDWINSQYINDTHQSFLSELTEGQEFFDTEDELILVLSFLTQGKSTPQPEDYTLKSVLVSQIDGFLKDHDIGYVDGDQIGGSSIEIFCAINDFEHDKQLILDHLKAQQLILPNECYKE